MNTDSVPTLRPASREWLRQHPVAVLLILTFGLTWAVWLPRAAGIEVGVAGPLSTWAPAVAAVVAAATIGGTSGVADLGARLMRWRVHWWWYAVVLLGPVAFSTSVAMIAVALGTPWSSARPSMLATPLTQLVAFLVILTLTDGLGEEVAWRGFALPRLLCRFRALTASLILGVVWALWHLPLLWTEGSALYGQPIWLLVLDLAAKSVVFTWVFLRTQGSLLLAVLLHATTNLAAVSPPIPADGDLTLPLVALAVKWLVVFALIPRLADVGRADRI